MADEWFGITTGSGLFKGYDTTRKSIRHSTAVNRIAGSKDGGKRLVSVPRAFDSKTLHIKQNSHQGCISRVPDCHNAGSRQKSLIQKSTTPESGARVRYGRADILGTQPFTDGWGRR